MKIINNVCNFIHLIEGPDLASAIPPAAAAVLTAVVASTNIPQGFTEGVGQIPAGAAVPGLLAGGIAITAAPAYVAGVALSLTPAGLTPPVTFPPFETPRTLDAVAVTFLENDQIQPRHLQRRRKRSTYSDFSKVPSEY